METSVNFQKCGQITLFNKRKRRGPMLPCILLLSHNNKTIYPILGLKELVTTFFKLWLLTFLIVQSKVAERLR